MDKLFFVIPVYNVEKYLKRCVDSVIKQTYDNIQIVLINDGSTDTSGSICDEYAKKYNNVTVIHKENGGLSDARNAGLKYVFENAADTDYLTFLDSDDFVRCDYAKRMIELCEKNSCDLAQCGYEKGDKDGFSPDNNVVRTHCTTNNLALLGYMLKSQSCAKLYKVRVFSGVTFPYGVINEDEFVTYKAVYNSDKVIFTDENLYYYYQHSTSIMDNVAKKLKNNPRRYDFMEAYRQRIEFFEEKKLPDQVMKTKEKICTDIILRYCEQMYIKKEDRDTDSMDGTYLRIYRKNFKEMIKRHNMPMKKRLMYNAFYAMPLSAVLMGKIFTLRK